nr:uncharacterized protein CTRU02_05223 [Colletotrichum truncatum]KAF6794391.1 hypothetical protein CTRU02_05223 [Colletotrichum truncatum]
MPSLCHMCGIGGELMMDFKQVYYVASISSANCKQFMESMDENRNEDVASDTNVLLHGIGEETCVRRPEGLDSGSVEEWVSDQQAIVERMRRRLRYILRGKRWSRKKLVPRKPGRRPPVIFISSAPCGLATISEDKELKFPVRRRTAIE